MKFFNLLFFLIALVVSNLNAQQQWNLMVNDDSFSPDHLIETRGVDILLTNLDRSVLWPKDDELLSNLEFSPIGATWYHNYQELLPYDAYGYKEYYAEKDTVIDNLPLRKISVKHVYANGLESSYSDQYVYQVSETIYGYTKDKGLELYYDFNLIAGDTLAVNLDQNEICDSVSPVIIDAVELVIIHGVQLKKQTLKTTYWYAEAFGGHSHDFSYEVVELVGGFEAPLELPVCSSEGYFGATGLRCYTDSSIHFESPSWRSKFPELACDGLINKVGIRSNEVSDVSVYPNPVSDALCVSLKNKEQVKVILVYSVDGGLVKKDVFHNLIDMSEFNSGLYFLQIVFLDGSYETVEVFKK